MENRERGKGQLDEIRTEIKRLGDIGKEERDVLRNYGSQITAIKRDLNLVRKQIDFERERRQELEKTLDAERSETLPSEHAEAIKRREDDIRLIRDEKAAMLEWLQRGVAEAQRITMQVEALKASVTTSESTAQELLADKRKLEEMHSRLELELEETKAKIKRLTEGRTTLEEHTEHQAGLISVTEDIIKSTQADSDRLAADVNKLQTRGRDVETMEITVGCMAAAVRHALHDLEVIHNAAAKGEVPPDDEYDSEEEADDTQLTPVVISGTKAKIGRCEAILVTLWSSLRRFDADQKYRADNATRAHNEKVALLQKELDQLRIFIFEDLKKLRQSNEIREPMLRRFLNAREEAMKKAREESPSQQEGGSSDAQGAFQMQPFSLLDYIECENAKLAQEVGEIEEDTARLRARVSEMEKDYSAVKELKQTYRELESEKAVLSHSIRKAESENRAIKMSVQERSLLKVPTVKPKQRPWKVNALD